MEVIILTLVQTRPLDTQPFIFLVTVYLTVHSGTCNFFPHNNSEYYRLKVPPKITSMKRLFRGSLCEVVAGRAERAWLGKPLTQQTALVTTPNQPRCQFSEHG